MPNRIRAWESNSCTLLFTNCHYLLAWGAVSVVYGRCDIFRIQMPSGYQVMIKTGEGVGEPNQNIGAELPWKWYRRLRTTIWFVRFNMELNHRRAVFTRFARVVSLDLRKIEPTLSIYYGFCCDSYSWYRSLTLVSTWPALRACSTYSNREVVICKVFRSCVIKTW